MLFTIGSLTIALLASSAFVTAQTPISVPLSVSPSDQYTASVTIGSEAFNMIIDTGSSNAWVASSSYSCVNITTGQSFPSSSCGFGTLYNANLSFIPVVGKHMSSYYGSGAYTSGPVGFDNWTVADTALPMQEFGAVTIAQFGPPDNFTSGILGLAYPAGTDLFNGSAGSLSFRQEQSTTYTPFIFSASSIGFFEPFFSLALTPTDGLMVLGGIPNITTSSAFTTVDIEKTPFMGRATNFSDFNNPNSTFEYLYYFLNVSSVTYGTSSSSLTSNITDFRAYVDSGNLFTELPLLYVKAINSLFNPPASPTPILGGYYSVACNATPPVLGFEISNQTFFSNPKSMIVNMATVQEGASGCASSVVVGEDVGVLGHAFLTGVVAVFNVQNNTMSFASRDLGVVANTTMTSGVLGRKTELHGMGFLSLVIVALAVLVM